MESNFLVIVLESDAAVKNQEKQRRGGLVLRVGLRTERHARRPAVARRPVALAAQER